MRCSVLLLLVTVMYCGCDPLLRQETKPWLNPSLSEVVPSLPSSLPPVLTDGPDVSVFRDSPLFSEHVNLRWQPFNGSLPRGALSIFNDYTERTEYVCKVRCESGFYSALKGELCYYPFADREYASASFELLVNVDHFEVVQWVDESHGDVPPLAVRTCPGVDVFVGKNRYGLGKVVTTHEAFFLPWEGEEYWYKSYEVLSVDGGSYTQHVSHVEYAVDHMRLLHHPPEALQFTRVTNLQCNSFYKNVRLEKTTVLEKHWDIGRETRNGSVSSMTAQMPILGSGNVDFTEEQTVTFSEGTRTSESLSHTVELQILVPPRHWCGVRMEGRRMTADIPFTARLSRTNGDGQTRWTSVSGSYSGVSLGHISTVVERCRPLEDAPPCEPHLGPQ